MNGSWSDASDRSGELDLVNPGSQSEASGEEFESSDEADNDEGEELDQAENSNEQNFIQRQVQSAEEADHNIEVEDEGEALDNSGDTLVSLDEDLAGVDGSKPSHGVINMHHVDMILDNIDAELHNIINRSRTSEASEHSFQSGQTRTRQSLVQEIQMPESLSEESNDDTTADEEEHDDNGFDTGLGTSSLPRDSSLVPRMDHTHQGNGIVQMNGVAKNSRDKKRLSNKRNQRDPRRKPIAELSDVDSICSEDIRIRMEETLNLQDSDTNTLHTHNPSFTHDAPSQYSTPRYSAHSPHHETPRGEQTETTSDQELQVADKEDGDREEITSRIKEIVSMALSESASAGSSSDSTQVLGRYHHQRSKELRNSNVKTASSSAAPTSRTFQEHRRAGRGCDMDSIATEDFEHIFQTSIIRPQSSSSNNLRHSPKKHAAVEKPSHPVGTLKSSPPLKDTDRLMVPGHGKRGKSRHRKKRTATVPTSKPSGLPEYMYLRKEVTESDLGSDSIKTEEYEGHFEVAKVIDYHSTPKYAKESKLPKRLRGHNVQSDPESIQTEEYEQRFRSLMVKHVAGVQVKSFDQVSIQSDLESVETGMVHQKFQEALQKGPEVKVFDEYGDRSDTDPMQMEELEQKFQAVLKQKKKDKKRYTQQDTDEGGTSDVDSVRVIPSKSETGSPQNRQGTTGRKQAQRLLNGGRQTHHSRDPSPRSSAYSSSRSSPRVTSTPARPQPSASSPWGTPRDISPSPPQQSPTLQQGVHPQFAFAPQLQGKPCGNHEKAAQSRGKDEPLYSQDEVDMDTQRDAPRTKPGAKKKKKRSIRENSIKTSTPKANPGRHYRNGSMEFEEQDGPSGNNNMATIKELLAAETKMKRKLNELESSFEEISSKKQVALGDLKNLREAVHRNKRDIHKAEEITRESMERADGLRSELMVLEYQRDQARRELQDLEHSIATVNQPIGSGIPEEETNGVDNNNSLMGFSPKEVIAVIKERDELKMRVRNGEGDLSPMERSELERQLSSTKQELFNGQKSSRARMDSLQEELEESRHNIEDLLNQKSSLTEKVKELQTLFISEHQDQRELHVEERNKLLEQLNGKLQKEVETLRQQLLDKDQHLHQVSTTVTEKDKINEALGEKILGMQREAEEEGKGVERSLKEMEGKVRNADVVKELAMVELREALLKEKDQEIENLKLRMEKEAREALAAQDEKTSALMMITKRSLTEREEDLRAVKSQLVQQTEEAQKMEQQLKEQTEEMIKSAVERERQERDEEYTRRRREEMRERELEVAKETARLQGELHVGHQRHEHLQTTVSVLKEELDKVREENLAAGREKVEAVSEAREKARDEIQRELDQLREQLATENLLEMDKLRHKLRQQEEEVTKLRSEVKVHQEKEATMSSLTKSKSILSEINEECRRTAAVINTTPIKLNISSIKGNKTLNGTLSPKSPFASTQKSTQSPGRTQIVAALTNLRISNEELRNYVQTQKSELERQKRALAKAQKEKEDEVKKVANTIGKKSEDMDTMRDRLIQDHLAQVEELQQQTSRLRTNEGALQERLLDKDSELREIQQSMTQWKEETALKMAKKFEEELSRELEIRLQEQINKRDGSSLRGSQTDLRSRHSSSGNVSPSTNSSASDASTIRLLKHLQERVKQLRTENMSLRRSSRGPLETSGEERSSLHSSRSTGSNDKDHLLYQLQQKVKLLERQLQVAEERCRENAMNASEKSSENSRLQGALTQQTKELMKMERAYSKLSTPPPRTPVRL
ncbi:uncharacterized protein [Asterias amurensis]|uniref:uncharacterized protein isoform X2 n=1 Tax=Asterias amurensis TaxID=7602 RepID=UPI003AB1F3BA